MGTPQLLKAYQFLLFLALLIVNVTRPFVSYFFRSVKPIPRICSCTENCVNANYFVLSLQLCFDVLNFAMTFLIIWSAIKSTAKDEKVNVSWMVALKFLNVFVCCFTELAVELDFLFSPGVFVTYNIIAFNFHFVVEFFIMLFVVNYLLKFLEKQRILNILPEVMKPGPQHEWIFLAPPAGQEIVYYDLAPVSQSKSAKVVQPVPKDARSESLRVLDQFVVEMFHWISCFEIFNARHQLKTFRPGMRLEDYQDLI
ncbi:hypothetical protein GCK72_024347 [Caenorhabditis remanei]|uniref:Uncharacterized protein n=1 Tax=Caenorhabditis remanei TaxID=31234 RepID=A0A6A5FZH3_CAERE|nr:hypothetical protein GCK72_024347 [Caenorhabditis remanei]KAF1747881.1 hypothetical protein GCK72_024347 [Caenorhabditis remanei]